LSNLEDASDGVLQRADAVIRRAALLAVAAAGLAGCGALRHIQVFQVSIVNDTRQPVVVRDCDHFCSSSPIAFHLEPGASAAVNRTTHQHKSFSITTAAGTHVGCLDLYYPTQAPGAQALVSAAGRCPGGSGQPWKAVAIVLLAVLVAAVAVPAFRARRAG
jgi:hypothetical protein